MKNANTVKSPETFKSNLKVSLFGEGKGFNPLTSIKPFAAAKQKAFIDSGLIDVSSEDLLKTLLNAKTLDSRVLTKSDLRFDIDVASSAVTQKFSPTAYLWGMVVFAAQYSNGTKDPKTSSLFEAWSIQEKLILNSVCSVLGQSPKMKLASERVLNAVTMLRVEISKRVHPDCESRQYPDSGEGEGEGEGETQGETSETTASEKKQAVQEVISTSHFRYWGERPEEFKSSLDDILSDYANAYQIESNKRYSEMKRAEVERIKRVSMFDNLAILNDDELRKVVNEGVCLMSDVARKELAKSLAPFLSQYLEAETKVKRQPKAPKAAKTEAA